MKIGILTFHKSINYGSVLQAWAMQDILLKKGYKVELIDYEPYNYKNRYDIYLPIKNTKSIIKNILRLPVARYAKKQIEGFEKFRNRNLLLSDEKYNSYSDPKNLESKYDCIICGSDQIWNVHAQDCDDFYFLPNVNKKKIAYAVSVNNTDFTEDRCNNEMRKWIEEFSFISCREKSGSEKIQKFIRNSKDVYNVLDPTLLHKKSDYDTVTCQRIIPGDYIFLYKVWGGSDSYKMAYSLGKKINMPVYTLFLKRDVISLLKIEKQGIKVIKKNTRPEDYLSLIKNASFVFTDSFHGTAFSIIFEKPFVCVNEKKKDGKLKNDERISNILQTFSLTERYITMEEIPELIFTDKISYSLISEKRYTLAHNTINALINAIEN